MKHSDFIAIQDDCIRSAFKERFGHDCRPLITYDPDAETIYVIVTERFELYYFEYGSDDPNFYFHPSVPGPVFSFGPTPELIAANAAYSLNPED